MKKVRMLAMYVAWILVTAAFAMSAWHVPASSLSRFSDLYICIFAGGVLCVSYCLFLTCTGITDIKPKEMPIMIQWLGLWAIKFVMLIFLVLTMVSQIKWFAMLGDYVIPSHKECTGQMTHVLVYMGGFILCATAVLFMLHIIEKYRNKAEMTATN